jgi:hypothetical protein
MATVGNGLYKAGTWSGAGGMAVSTGPARAPAWTATGPAATRIFDNRIELSMPVDSTAASFACSGISLGFGGSVDPNINMVMGTGYSTSELVPQSRGTSRDQPLRELVHIG